MAQTHEGCCRFHETWRHELGLAPAERTGELGLALAGRTGEECTAVLAGFATVVPDNARTELDAC